MQSWAVEILFLLSSLLGVSASPPPNSNWVIEQNWNIETDVPKFRASSSEILSECRLSPDKQIILPTVVHGVHSIFVDGQSFHSSGPTDFTRASPFYATLAIPCNELPTGHTLTWEVNSYSKYFARVNSYPSLRDRTYNANFFPITMNVFAFGAMFIFGLFVLVVFQGKIPTGEVLSIGGGSLLFSMYFLMVVNTVFSLPLSMLVAHKFADVGLWLGAALILNGFRKQGFLSSGTFLPFLVASLISVGQIILGRTGDEIQFGTMIPIPFVLVCTADICRLLFSSKISNFRVKILYGLAISIFLLGAVNDILVIVDVASTPMLLALGMPGALFTFGLALNEKISETYRERDTLLQTLETRVEEKTKSLSEAMHELKRSQAELVQSARLASLGTLSAGIAHEINNAINFVSGAIVPLERQLKKAEMDEVARARTTKLLGSMKEGTQLTVGIVKSLRSYTGLNQADVKAADIGELIDSVLLITKSRLRDIEVVKNFEPGLSATVHIVGLNQILMNLITNAADAVPTDKGRVEIAAYQEDDNLVLEINDNGCGMSPEVQQRIFEPFYTTKDVGKGTGLGMHIVHKEIQRHGGRLDIESVPDQGTSMKIYIPNAPEVSAKEAA